MMYYDHMFNPNYVNPTYYNQVQAQIMLYQQEQSKEVVNVVNAVHDMCEAIKKLDSQHQQEAFMLSLAEMAKEFGWDNN